MHFPPRHLLRAVLFAISSAALLYFSSRVNSDSRGAFGRFASDTPLASLASHKERVDLAVKLQVLKHLLAERFVIDRWRSGRAYNGPALDRLTECMLAGDCGPGESTVIILASFHFGGAQAGAVSGEDIWAHSTITAFQALNYTLLYAYGAMDALQIYQAIPDLVPIVIFEGSDLSDCIKRNKETADQTDTVETPGTWQPLDRIGCIRREGFEEGIPIWKTFVFHFWAGPATPLGSNWTLSPEDWNLWNPGKGNHYLGYSIEDRCTQIPVYPEREHRALILAKNAPMLQGKDFAWTGLLEGVVKNVPKSKEGQEFTLISTAGRSAADGGPDPLPEKGVVSMGKMPQLKWWNEVAKGKAMLGIGRPYLSPSPYDAMCFGVPFINVIFNRDEANPKDKSRWSTMHDALIPLDPPYVYHVKQHNADELEAALTQAVQNPIGRFIPPWMTLESVRERHRELVETDWRAAAAEVIATNWEDGNAPFLL